MNMPHFYCAAGQSNRQGRAGMCGCRVQSVDSARNGHQQPPSGAAAWESLRVQHSSGSVGVYSTPGELRWHHCMLSRRVRMHVAQGSWGRVSNREPAYPPPQPRLRTLQRALAFPLIPRPAVCTCCPCSVAASKQLSCQGIPLRAQADRSTADDHRTSPRGTNSPERSSCN